MDEEKINNDPYYVRDMSGPWCPCLPGFMNMPFFTLVFAALGVLVGALLAETDIHDTAKTCFSSPIGSSSSYVTADPVMKMTNYTWYDELNPPEGAFSRAAPGKEAKVAEFAVGSRDKAPSNKSCWLVLFAWPGKLWIRALKCLVSPLLACMMLLLPSKLGGMSGVGFRVAAFLLFTSTIAAMEGLIWANIIQPGNSITTADTELKGEKHINNYVSWLESLLGVVENAVPVNIVDEMANLRVLGIITFFLVFGYYLHADCPEQWSAPILNAGRGFLRCTMNYLRILMWFTPIAMFSLVSYNLMNIKNLHTVFEAVGMYVLTQLLGQFIHLFVFYMLFFFIMTRQNPLAFFAKIYEAPMTALATSSSAATMPVTLRVNLAEKAPEDDKGRAVVNFVVPLGAAINMDGTSLGFPIMVIFVSQMGQQLGLGGPMSFGDMLVVAILAMVCSLGTAPIPNAGLVYLTMLLESGNIKNERLQGLGIALITLFDWLVDRVETAQNVTSDSFISKIISTMSIADKLVEDETEMTGQGKI